MSFLRAQNLHFELTSEALALEARQEKGRGVLTSFFKIPPGELREEEGGFDLGGGLTRECTVAQDSGETYVHTDNVCN